jgi:hypothetical protein
MSSSLRIDGKESGQLDLGKYSIEIYNSKKGAQTTRVALSKYVMRMLRNIIW